MNIPKFQFFWDVMRIRLMGVTALWLLFPKCLTLKNEGKR
jgi:hypothetical protein